MCSQGGLFNFENEEYVIFYLLFGQGLASTIIQPRAHLSPASGWLRINLLIQETQARSMVRELRFHLT